VADLNNSEGKPFPGTFVDALEFHEYSLGCFGTAVTCGVGIGANRGGEHCHKLFSLAELSATFWAVNVSPFDFVHQLLKSEFLSFCIAHPCKFLKQVVGSKLSFALEAFNYRFLEMFYVARGFKYLSRHDHRRFDFKDSERSNVEISKLVFDSSFQYGPQRTEGYEATNASIYLIRRPKEASALRHFADDLKLVFGFHELFRSTFDKDFYRLKVLLNNKVYDAKNFGCSQIWIKQLD
jgi:hypothetical protein